MLRLGVNIDHVATLRNARGGVHPCPIRAALLSRDAGADGITAHLREDRRHIRDGDIIALKQEVALPLNLEMAATEEMLAIALSVLPHAVCIVPERREEVTTEGGLNVTAQEAALLPFVKALNDKGIRTSLFIDPDPEQIAASARVGARVVELHTGKYAHSADKDEELKLLIHAAKEAARLGLEVHAGHGLDFTNVSPVAVIPEIVELNIGHFLVGEAVFMGFFDAVIQMKNMMKAARSC